LKKLAREFITSLITVVVAILAIALYIHSGGTPVFYVIIVIAMLVGFYNAWLISRSEVPEAEQKPKVPQKRKRASKRSS
jgi:4-hydroxybenzoate polyprenyltransferase